MSAIITGTKGFRMTIKGTVPPELQSDEAAVQFWVAANINSSFTINGYIKEAQIEMIDLGLPPRPQ